MQLLLDKEANYFSKTFLLSLNLGLCIIPLSFTEYLMTTICIQKEADNARRLWST